jgi:plastocyanin
MTRRSALIARLLAIPSLLVLGIVAAPTASAGNPCFHGFTMPPATTESATEIKLMPCAFQPTVSGVAVGAEVTFFNGSDFTHLITGANQEWGSPDVELQPGKSVSYTFATAGVYPYACVLHPGMSGAIVVGDLPEAVAAGVTTNGSTTGGSTDGEALGATGGSATTAPAGDPPVDSPALIAFGIGAGVIAGAAAVWLALRRRPMPKPVQAAAE